MPNTKPLVQAATICEKVLQEKDSVVSVIRLVDTFHVEDLPAGLPEDIKSGAQVSALVALKSGDVTGEHEIEIRVRKPSGEVRQVGKWPVLFKGGEHGANFIFNMMISAGDLGLWWFDVVWQGEVLTSIPLRLARQSKPAPEPERR